MNKYENTLGLDFGTSFTTMSALDQSGRPTIINNQQGDPKTPTVIFFDEAGHSDIGKGAVKKLEDAAAEDNMEAISGTITNVKMRLSEYDYRYSLPYGLPGKTPVELVTLFFTHFKKYAEEQYFYHPIHRLRLTYPICFSRTTQQKLKEAAQNAGFREIELLQEPVAAALGFGSVHSSGVGSNILVFDMGAGTLDIAYIQRTEQGFTVPIKPKGFNECSGNVFDQLLYDYWSKQCLAENGFPFDYRENEVHLGVLSDCREARENLSKYETVKFRRYFEEKGKNVRLEIKRTEYEDLIREPVAKAMKLVRDMLAELKEDDQPIDTVLLIGGTSRTPLIIREMRRLHEEEKLLPVLPTETMIKDTAVGLGAVVDLDVLTSPKQDDAEARKNHKVNLHKDYVTPSPPKQDDAESQYRLGLSYYEGKGTPKDYTQAVDCFRKAAELGHAKAQCSLGYCYYHGHGLPKDYYEAAKWYKQAAVQGNASAQTSLGICYRDGKGITQNATEAAKWFQQSAVQGNVSAQCSLGDCYYYGKGVAQNYEMAVKWFQLAAEKGNAVAQCNLGDCYYYGNGVAQNYTEAVKWFEMAVNQGNAYAQWSLGMCYRDGKGVYQNYDMAWKLFEMSANQGDARGQCSLGECYYNGNGVVQNYDTALKWYKQSADQGNEFAKKALNKFSSSADDSYSLSLSEGDTAPIPKDDTVSLSDDDIVSISELFTRVF